jgi:hypothetical protein
MKNKLMTNIKKQTELEMVNRNELIKISFGVKNLTVKE